MVSDVHSDWGHQVKLRVVPWSLHLNRRGVAREGPEQDPLKQGLQNLGAIPFIVFILEL